MSTLTIPNESIKTTSSSNRNIHRLVRPTADLLVLEVGSSPYRWALLALAASPVVLALCIYLHADTMPTVLLSFGPVILAVVLAVAGFCFRRFGTRVRFDRQSQEVTVTGLMHGAGLRYAWRDIQGVQFCDAGYQGGPDVGSWHAFQVNLVLHDTEVTRVNLLDSSGESALRSIARGIAEFMGVAFYNGSDIG